MHQHDQRQKERAKMLRNNMTMQEILLWSHLRRKQVLGVKFNRQKPMFGYILDFYSHQIKLAIELDGSQHYYDSNILYDQARDRTLNHYGIKVLRYSNRDIEVDFNIVMDDIYNKVQGRL